MVKGTSKGTSKRARRMSDADIRLIVGDLDRWARGEESRDLTWAVVEEASGFTRQALNARAEIKAAFNAAKAALRDGGAARAKLEAMADNATLIAENARLRAQIMDLKEKEFRWKVRWQRIAYHIRTKGLQVSQIDQQAPEGAKLPSERETDSILRPLDQDIPRSGRI